MKNTAVASVPDLGCDEESVLGSGSRTSVRGSRSKTGRTLGDRLLCYRAHDACVDDEGVTRGRVKCERHRGDFG